MEINFSYPNVPSVKIDSTNLLGVFEPQELALGISEEELILQALAEPVGTPPLAEMVRGKKRVLIIVDDNTRLTPVHKILPYVLEELKKGGIPEEAIHILIGLGTHRFMTEEEIKQKVGEEIVKRFPVKSHDWKNPHAVEFLGHTPNGTEVWVNKEVLQSDFVIGLGHIVPHRVAGFSGGGKIIQPAVCGPKTTEQTHWLSAQYPGKEIMGHAENPVRWEIEAVARQAGLDFIFNVVQDRKGRIVEAVCGDLVAAHRRGCEVAKQVFGVRIPELGDIVVIDSYPADMEMWQAAKGIYSADLAVKEGGVIVLITPCPEGVASQHPEIEHFGYQPLERVQELVEGGELKDLTVAAHLVHVGEVICKKASCILVSSGIDREKAERIGFKWAATPEEALDKAFSLKGKEAKVLCFKHGGEILPLLE